MEFTLIKLRQILKDSENGIEQMVSLIPQFPIEVINEYWNSVWLQEPSNPDDRWESDWIRAILIAYSNDGSQPATFRDGRHIKRSNRKRTGTWIEDDYIFSITDEWSHIPVSILNNIINKLNIQKMRFDGRKLPGTAYQDYQSESVNLFTKWIENPCTIEHLEIFIDTDVEIASDFFLKIENNISNQIKSLFIRLRGKSRTKFFKIRSSFLNRFNNLEKVEITTYPECNQ